jgi:hypothetical protein
VSRVTPPTTTIANTSAQQAKSQPATGRAQRLVAVEEAPDVTGDAPDVTGDAPDAREGALMPAIRASRRRRNVGAQSGKS